jgi:hypothetical protein
LVRVPFQSIQNNGSRERVPAFTAGKILTTGDTEVHGGNLARCPYEIAALPVIQAFYRCAVGPGIGERSGLGLSCGA